MDLSIKRDLICDEHQVPYTCRIRINYHEPRENILQEVYTWSLECFSEVTHHQTIICAWMNKLFCVACQDHIRQCLQDINVAYTC